jgi:Flp pilus assembly pilin Flp
MARLTVIFWCRKGATAIEYALVASLISIAGLAAFQLLGDNITTMYGNVSNKM